MGKKKATNPNCSPVEPGPSLPGQGVEGARGEDGLRGGLVAGREGEDPQGEAPWTTCPEGWPLWAQGMPGDGKKG